MGMVVRTNYSALNATNHLNKNGSSLSKSIEKLSSGFKVNKAADDASGLAISEKMKAQIKALDTAVNNCDDGVGLIQTTEGYLDTIHTMLNRMVELSMKSANGVTELGTAKTYAAGVMTAVTASADTGVAKGGWSAAVNKAKLDGGSASGVIQSAATDRDALQVEMNQLCAEIDRVAATANFNNVKLFTGALTNESYTRVNNLTTADLKGTSSKDIVDAITAATTNQVSGVDTTNSKKSFTLTELGLNPQKPASGAADAAGNQISGVTLGFKSADSGSVAKNDGEGLTLQIGETSNAADKLVVNVDRMHTDALFSKLTDYTNTDGDSLVRIDINGDCTVKGVVGYTIDISGQKRAGAAAEALRSVINDVSDQRAKLGAMQNRLDYTSQNLTTASENITAANSRIRDTDMAKEMTKFTQQNVLVQAAQSMLAQANAQPQNVLSLLR